MYRDNQIEDHFSFHFLFFFNFLSDHPNYLNQKSGNILIMNTKKTTRHISCSLLFMLEGKMIYVHGSWLYKTIMTNMIGHVMLNTYNESDDLMNFFSI